MALEIRSGLKRHTFITTLQAVCGAIGIYFFVNWCYLAYTDAETMAIAGDDPSTLIMVLAIPLVIGVTFLLLAYKNEALLRLYKRYEPAVKEARGGKISEVAKALNAQDDAVTRNLELMISKKLFENLVIDDKKQALVIAEPVPAEEKKKKGFLRRKK
jgi:hypothetical protein